MKIFLAILVAFVSFLFIAGCNQEQARRTPPASEEPSSPQEPTKERTRERTKPQNNKQNNKEKTKPAAQKPQTFRIGETAYFDNSKVTVYSYTPGVQSDNQFIQPDPGMDLNSLLKLRRLTEN